MSHTPEPLGYQTPPPGRRTRWSVWLWVGLALLGALALLMFGALTPVSTVRVVSPTIRVAPSTAPVNATAAPATRPAATDER